jgi:uncharacterized damage-inducible protein DinB
MIGSAAPGERVGWMSRGGMRSASSPRNVVPMIDEVLEAWRVNQRVNLHLIERISDEGMHCTLSERGGRNVVRQFAHLHYVRILQLQHQAKTLAKGARLFETYDEPDRDTLVAALEDSSHRVEEWIRLAHEGAQDVKTFKRGLFVTVAYLISHESHHRGNVLLTLKQCGHAIPSAERYAIWDWDRI